MRILIIDDDVNVKEMFDVFRTEGISYITVVNELNALSYLTSQSDCFDAVLLDLSLPNIDGLELAEQIRLNETMSKCPQIRMAFYTSFNIENSADIQRFMDRVKVERTFRKPIDPFELTTQVKEWLSHPYTRSTSYGQ